LFSVQQTVAWIPSFSCGRCPSVSKGSKSSKTVSPFVHLGGTFETILGGWFKPLEMTLDECSTMNWNTI
jgi:hypothetical protein